MPTALLADDEPILLAELRALLGEAWPDLQIVGEATHGAAAFRLIESLRPDIVFLDIRMPSIDGLQLARMLPRETALVFVSAHPEHALDAFEHAAVDYLRKPVTAARLAMTVSRLQARVATALGSGTRLRFLQAWCGNTLRIVNVDEVSTLRSDLRHTEIWTTDGRQLLLRTGLGELLGQLDPQTFWQIHRSVAVNVQALERVVRGDDGELSVWQRGCAHALPVSRAHRQRFNGM